MPATTTPRRRPRRGRTAANGSMERAATARDTVVTLADLQDDDRGFFQKDHNNSCPGLVKVDFYGDGKPTLALVLIKKKDEAKESAILVAHQVEATWNITMLATGGPSVPACRQASTLTFMGRRQFGRPDPSLFFSGMRRGVSFMLGQTTG